MTRNELLKEISKLEVSQRILLLEEAWDTLKEAHDQIEMPEWQKSELDQRWKDHLDNPNDVIPADHVHQEIRNKLK